MSPETSTPSGRKSMENQLVINVLPMEERRKSGCFELYMPKRGCLVEEGPNTSFCKKNRPLFDLLLFDFKSLKTQKFCVMPCLGVITVQLA